MPLFRPLLIGKRGVQNGNPIAENLTQVRRHRRREPNFRDKENGRAPCVEHRAHAGKINGSLARPRDAMQQHAGKLARVHRFLDALERFLLRAIELEIKWRRSGLQRGHGEASRLFNHQNDSSLYESAQRCAGNLQRVQSVDGHFSSRGGECVD